MCTKRDFSYAFEPKTLILTRKICFKNRNCEVIGHMKYMGIRSYTDIPEEKKLNQKIGRYVVRAR